MELEEQMTGLVAAEKKLAKRAEKLRRHLVVCSRADVDEDKGGGIEELERLLGEKDDILDVSWGGDQAEAARCDGQGWGDGCGVLWVGLVNMGEGVGGWSLQACPAENDAALHVHVLQP